MQGTISKLVTERGFGFISADGQEFFFHQSALQGADYADLAPGLPVVFEVDRDPKGDEAGERPRAVSIRLAGDAVPAVDHAVLPREKTV